MSKTSGWRISSLSFGFKEKRCMTTWSHHILWDPFVVLIMTGKLNRRYVPRVPDSIYKCNLYQPKRIHEISRKVYQRFFSVVTLLSLSNLTLKLNLYNSKELYNKFPEPTKSTKIMKKRRKIIKLLMHHKRIFRTTSILCRDFEDDVN
jgi:hypothetical protein